MDDDRPRAYFHVIADLDVAKNFRARADDHSISQGWMPLACLFSRATECHSLVKEHVVPYFRSLANHDAHAVIDEKTPPYFRARMNFNAGECPRKLAHDAGERVPARRIQAVRETMR